MDKPAPQEEFAPKNDDVIKVLTRSVNDTLKEGRDASNRVFETFNSMSLRIIGFMLVGDTAGILTVLQYLFFLSNEHVAGLIALSALLSFAIGTTAACVALMQFYQTVSEERNVWSRLSYSLLEFNVVLDISRLASESTAKIKSLQQSLLSELNLVKYLHETSFLRPFHKSLKASAWFFLFGFWSALTAASEHLWHWSDYIATAWRRLAF
jgi:hypothetical protein